MFWKADKGYIRLKSSRAVDPLPPPKPQKAFLFFGVILPLLALLVEVTTHFCAMHFFDPFPSFAHAAMFALIPISNFLVYLSHRRDLTTFYAPMIMSNGMAFGIAILYTLMLLPIVPLSLAATLLLGFGLLGLAPMLCLYPTWRAGHVVVEKATKAGTFFNPKELEHLGHAIILITVIVVEIPSTFTRIALHMASQPQSEKQGLELLRNYGSPEVMLRACYERSGRATDIIGSLYECKEPLPVDTARRLFFRVTGRSFNSMPIPASARATMVHGGNVQPDELGVNGGVNDEFDFDPDVAGEMVSGVARGLTAASSRMQTVVKPEAKLAVMDWDIAFHNISDVDREARARILLPPGAVVNRASVVIDGKERAAKIMLKQEARAVYRASIAAKKKDPLLVSSAGVDRLLLQCYPVRKDHDVVAKLHIVLPVVPIDGTHGVVNLPSFEERNFQMNTEDQHSFSASSTMPIKSPFAGLKAEHVGSKFGLTGNISGADLSRGNALIQCDTTGAPETILGGPRYALETSVERRGEKPSRLALVIDGSASMKESMPLIVESLQQLPRGVYITATYVMDGVEDLIPYPVQCTDEVVAQLVNTLKGKKAEGGQDDSAALQRALNSVGRDGTVLWIHGAQPQTADAPTALKYLFTKGALRWSYRKTPALYDMQVVSGPNQMLDGLPFSSAVSRVPRIGTPKDDLLGLFKRWSPEQKYTDVSYSFGPAVTRAGAAVTAVSRAPAHDPLRVGLAGAPEIATLAAYNVVTDELRRENPSGAYALAQQYKLITPVSSAVVVSDEVDKAAHRRQEYEERRRLRHERWRSDHGEDYRRMHLHDAIRGKAKDSISGVVSQLNSLNPLNASEQQLSRERAVSEAPSSPSSAALYSASSPYDAKKESVTGYEPGTSRGPALYKQDVAAGAAGGGSDSFGDDGSASGVAFDKAPTLQGATNGTIGPSAMDEEGGIASADSPEAKPVPEADSIFLFGIALLMFGAIGWRSRGLRTQKVR